MSKSVTILRNSLIALALSAALPAWPADSGRHKSSSVPVQVPATHTLDLKAPDIRDVMPADAWNSVLPNPDVVVEPETVQVQGGTAAPFVPGGFAALYWAATHPSNAWRILAPVQ